MEEGGDGNAVTVAVRIRPVNTREQEAGEKPVVAVQGGKTIVVDKNDGSIVHKWAYDYVWDSTKVGTEGCATQQTVYNDYGTKVIKAIFEGFNACIFAYGQTGSGKTHSMMGSGMGEQRGLIPRLCEEIVSRTESHHQADSSHTYSISMSFLEIYQEKVKDLINPTAQNLRVREHPSRGVYVDNLTYVTATSESEIMQCIEDGNKVRHVASTQMNDASSRSHAVFSLEVTHAVTTSLGDEDVTQTTTSKVVLVDLAGSERQKSTGATGERLAEGALINKSLTSLGLVINALAERSKKQLKGDDFKGHVPFRDSTLTWLLKDTLGGNSKTFMVSTISCTDGQADETLSTLRYADRAKSIVTKPVVNEDPIQKIIKALQAEVESYRNQATQYKEKADNADQIIRTKVKKVHEIYRDKLDVYKSKIEELEKSSITARSRSNTLEQEQQMSDTWNEENRRLKAEIEKLDPQKDSESILQLREELSEKQSTFEKERTELRTKADPLTQQLLDYKKKEQSWKKEKARLKSKVVNDLEDYMDAAVQSQSVQQELTDAKIQLQKQQQEMEEHQREWERVKRGNRNSLEREEQEVAWKQRAEEEAKRQEESCKLLEEEQLRLRDKEEDLKNVAEDAHAHLKDHVSKHEGTSADANPKDDLELRARCLSEVREELRQEKSSREQKEYEWSVHEANLLEKLEESNLQSESLAIAEQDRNDVLETLVNKEKEWGEAALAFQQTIKSQESACADLENQVKTNNEMEEQLAALKKELNERKMEEEMRLLEWAEQKAELQAEREERHEELERLANLKKGSEEQAEVARQELSQLAQLHEERKELWEKNERGLEELVDKQERELHEREIECTSTTSELECTRMELLALKEEFQEKEAAWAAEQEKLVNAVKKCHEECQRLKDSASPEYSQASDCLKKKQTILLEKQEEWRAEETELLRQLETKEKEDEEEVLRRQASVSDMEESIRALRDKNETTEMESRVLREMLGKKVEELEKLKKGTVVRWTPNSSSKYCEQCRSTFSFFNRRHHCRKCGELVCGPCSSYRGFVPEISSSPVRICKKCN